MKPTLVPAAAAKRIYPFNPGDWFLRRSRFVVECGWCSNVWEVAIWPGTMLPVERLPWPVWVRCPRCEVDNDIGKDTPVLEV